MSLPESKKYNLSDIALAEFNAMTEPPVRTEESKQPAKPGLTREEFEAKYAEALSRRIPEISPKIPIGIGGAPLRASTLPTEAKDRKAFPIASGLMDYFPDALAAVSHVSYHGNQQHNAGKPLHWDRSKSTDEADTMLRHFLQRGSLDTDGIRHSAKMVWRALALLQKEIEAEFNEPK